VGETFRDPQQLEIVLRGLHLEVEARPFAEVGRVVAKIDGHVPDVTGEDTHEFALRLLNLVMQAAEYALDGKGLVVLDESARKTGGGKC